MSGTIPRLPLSFGQRRLWFLDQLRPGAVDYNLPMLVRLRGRLDVGALRAALTEIVARHEVLRTRYAVADGEPVAVVEESAWLELTETDARGLDRDRVAELVESGWRRPFDLAGGQVLRVALHRLADDEHLLLIVAAHIAFDGWSWGVLARELRELYRSLTTGEPAALAPLPIQYSDFARWQQEWFSGQRMADQLTYWRGTLADLAPLELPTDRPRPPIIDATGARTWFTVPAYLVAELARIAREHRASPFMVLLAGFQLLLGRYAGTDDVAVGSPVAGRSRVETEDLIGFFVNTLVLRADLRGDPSFADLLERVRNTTLDAFDHADVPFERLVDELVPDRDLSRNPLYQVSFVLQNAAAEPLALPGMAVEPAGTPFAASPFDMTLHLVEQADGSLAGVVDYASALFDGDTITRLGGHYVRLLTSIAADPAARLSELEWLTEPERTQLLVDWNDTETPMPSAGVHELFEAQADRAPEAVALRFGGDELTYAEVNAAANRLAARLRSWGVGHESVVALLLPREPALVIAVLGVLKAGAAYLPLDPDHPADRLRDLIADSGVAAVLTTATLCSTVDGSSPVLLMEDDPGDFPADNPVSESTPDSLAYVVYTSGSTGRPKGVPIPHRALVNYVTWCQSAYATDGDAGSPLYSSLAFDMPVTSVFPALLSGKTVTIIEETGEPGLGALVAALERGGFGLLKMTPSHLAVLGQSLSGDGIRRAAQRLVVGGEELPGELLAPWVRHAPDTMVDNEYGPTETTVGCSLYEGAAAELPSGVLPIGKPIANTRMYVLDDDLRLLPVGVVGELYIGGAQLARGYTGRPDLTAARFVPDPYSPEPGGRLYRSGDLARYRADGNIVFAGRVDDYVKIGGYRVEPTEVEETLTRHPAVRTAVVVVRDRQLVAYVLPADGADLEIGDLRAYLAGLLPAYLVPPAFVILTELPFTPSGKIDRKALPAPEVRRADLTEYVAPATPAQQTIAAVWAEVLDVDRVGVHDDFFDLGGHSLLATRAIFQLRDAFDADLPLRLMFEHRTVAGLADVITNRAAPADRTAPIVATRRDGPAPLSFGQHRLWFLDRLQPSATDYLSPVALRLRGAVDLAALDGALTKVVARHEVLRTRFREIDGEPTQLIDPPGPVPVERVDLTGLDPAAREASVHTVIAADLATPFDLRRQWPVRATVIRLADDEHVLLLTMHHSAFDGWSVDILATELADGYAEVESTVDTLSVQYTDYAVWQRELLDGGALAGQLDYWRHRLAGLAPLELPTDRPRPPVRDSAGDGHAFTVPAELARTLTKLGRGQGATPFMVLLTAFQVLLGRYTGQADVAVGTPVAGRDRAEIEKLIGFFVNTVVMRADLSGEPSFVALLNQVRRGAIDAYANADLPFERLVDELRPTRDLSRNPLFGVLFDLRHAQRMPFRFDGIEVEPVGVDLRIAKFDLSLTVDEQPDGELRCFIDYATALFDRTTIERMAGHFGRLLASIAADPDAPVSRLDLLTDTEREQLLVGWRGQRLERPRKTLPELFADQARSTPDAPAVVSGDRELTYARLNTMANQLADHLRSTGVGAETPVAVAMRRDVDLVVALIAVLKAGACFVPLDPDYPADRLAFMVRDAGARVVLTQSVVDGQRVAGEATVLAVDTLWDRLAACSADDPPPVDPLGAAYVMYTSGSTGEPKGVIVTHAGIRNRVLWAVDRHRLSPADRLLQKTTIGFDAAMWEFLGPLVSGGAVVMAPDGVQRDAAAMVRAVIEHEITVLQLVPSMLRLLVEEPGLAGCRSLRMVFCGGEALPARLCARVREILDVEVFNTFGMTECSIDVTAALYDPAEPGEIVPAGTALPNTQILVLDAADNPVPVGLPGEICVAGVHLARGYTNRPGATAVRFTPNPHPTVPGDRLCRSGDLGRWRADGSLEVLGRLDHQVKVNGVRIELGEIEAALSTHPGVRVGVVTVHQPSAGDKRLVAYVLPADGARPDAAALRAHLGQRLPAPMLPSIFLTLDELPLTSSGKVDRTALPVPDAHRSDLAGEYVEPGTPDECVVAAVWSDVLGVDRVGARDNFFELGGHSLLATRVIFRLRQVLGVELPLADMFTTPTVAGVAELLGQRRAGAATTPITPVPGSDGLALSFAQQRLWFLDQLDPGSTEYLVPFALRLRGPLDADALEAALTDVIARHETLRTRYVATGGEPAQVIDPPRPLRLRRTDLGDRDPARVVDEESLQPIALDQEWPIRARLVALAPDEHLFLLTMHHIAGDAWSTGLLFTELAERYRAHRTGAPSPVDALAVRYADFAAWQRDWFTGAVRENELAYWRDRLAGLTPTELPTDRPRAAQRDLAGAFVSVEVPSATGDAVLGIGRTLGATPFMVLLAAFQVLLATYTGERDVVVGTPVTGRTRAETADMIGLFVNTLLLRGDLTGDPGFPELVARVRDAAVRDYPHQDLPFEQLVDELAPERDLSRNPLFQIMFEADAAGETALVLGDAVVEPAYGTWHAAKFDLSVRVEYRQDAAMTVHFEYATALFDRTTVERMAGHFRTLLESIAAQPETPVLDLELRTEAEQREWLRLGAGTPAEEFRGCVPELFERQVAATPDAVAMVFGDLELTYAELNARANRLAHHLSRLGVGKENAVAVCLERGPEVIVALLGVLKIGGVYVPFDPDHPAKRLWAMLDDAGADVVLTQRRFADRLSSGRAKVLAMDDDQPPYAQESAGNPATVVGPDDLAYMIYTSGSTGQPKGVLIQHGSYVEHCAVIATAYDIVVGDRVVLLSALTFDAAMDQMAATLLSGATVVVSDPVFWTPAELPGKLARYGVTTIEITPAYYREMLASLGADTDRLNRLKLMNVGSDVVTVDDARRWAETGLPAPFLCNYGPTEATVTCILYPVSGDLSDARGEASMPLGQPVPGTRAYVVDTDLRPLPVGVPGELLLGGVRLARGYHRRPGLTAERFVPDPFGDEPGARLYRTGDLVRRRADGDIEFLGRIDQQVKIRGFRIELGEIEAALAAHPDVRAVAVIATHAGAGERGLAAYLVMRDGATLDPARLRTYLRERIPDYMIPSWWTALSALPLTTSKKVNRKALPAPAQTRPDLDESYVAPRDTAEEVIAGIWAEVLGLDRIGVQDDFFVAGGHSLLATRVLARLRDAFGVEVPLRTLFEATTVAELAETVTAAIEAEIDQLTDAEVALQLAEEGTL